jgi:hypothetical protein
MLWNMKSVCEGPKWLNVEDNLPLPSEEEKVRKCKSPFENSRVSCKL